MAVSITTKNITDVNTLYVALFGRAPDGVGLGYWARELAGTDTVAPKSLVTIANTMFGLDAARPYYPSSQTNEEVVSSFYLKVLGRAPDAVGAAYWLTALNKVGATPGSVIVDMVAAATNWKPSGLPADAATDAAGTISKNLFANKMEVSTYFGSKNGSIAAAELALVGVTDAAATVTSAKASIDSSATSSGQTFTLTTGADTSGTLVGSGGTTSTTGSDTFNASLEYAAGGTTVASTSTLSVLDAINGGSTAGTTDTLNVTVTGGNAGTTFAAALIEGIETLNIRNLSGQTNSLDVSTIAGLTGIYADRATAAVTLTNVATGATVGVKGNGTLTNGAFNFGYKTAADAINLAISGGVTAGAITGDATGVNDAATAATISSTGAANVVGTVDLLTGFSTLKTLTINAATNLKGQIAAQTEGDFAATSTLTVSGAATLVELTGALANAITTVNAGGLTAGGIKATLGSGTVTATGGAGVDTITLGAVDAIVSTGAGNDTVVIGTNILTGSVNGGDGTDTVTIAAGNALTTATAAKITGVEVLEVSSGATQTYDYSLISGLNALTVAAGTSIIVNKLAASTPVTVTGVQTTDLALNLASTSGNTDSLNLTLTNQDAADLTIAVLSITGVETLNVTSSFKAATPQVGTFKNVITTLAGTNNSSLQTVTLSGATEVSVTTGALAQSLTINASSATGKTTIVATNLGGVATITGGSGADTITGSSQADTVNAGAGADKINLHGSADTMNGEAGDDNFATVAALTAVAGLTLNGGDGSDTITVLGNTTADFSAVGVTITSIEKLAYDATAGATGATFSGAQLNNAAIEVAGSTNTDTLTVSLTAGASVNLSSLTFKGSTWTAGTDIIAINGSTAGETIVGTSANDTITAGTGIDTITLGTGNDSVVLGTGGALIAANRDVITGFTAGTTAATKDVINVAVGDTTVGTAAAAAIVIQTVTTAPTGTTTFSTNNDVLALNFEAATGTGKVLADSVDGTALLASLGQSIDITADTNKGFIVAYQAGNAYIYHAVEGADAGNAVFAAADIVLVGVLNGVAVGALVADNFLLRA